MTDQPQTPATYWADQIRADLKRRREAEADHDPRKQADPTDTPRTTESEEQA